MGRGIGKSRVSRYDGLRLQMQPSMHSRPSSVQPSLHSPFWQHSWCTAHEVAGNGGESLEVSQNQHLYVLIMKIMIYQIIYIYTLYLRCTHTYIVSTNSHIQVFSILFKTRYEFHKLCHRGSAYILHPFHKLCCIFHAFSHLFQALHPGILTAGT